MCPILFTMLRTPKLSIFKLTALSLVAVTAVLGVVVYNTIKDINNDGSTNLQTPLEQHRNRVTGAVVKKSKDISKVKFSIDLANTQLAEKYGNSEMEINLAEDYIIMAEPAIAEKPVNIADFLQEGKLVSLGIVERNGGLEAGVIYLTQ